MSRGDARALEAIEWIHDVREEGVVTYRMGRRGRTLVAEWPSVARLTCRDDGSASRLTPSAGVSPGSLGKLRGTVRAMIGGLRGGLGLHASAVAMGRQAVLLLGPGGAGKSTAAAELCLRHRGRLLADDAALVEERGGVLRAVPSEGRHYLTVASAESLGVRPRGPGTSTGKAGVTARRASAVAVRVALAAVLEFDDALEAPVCRPLGGAAAALAVLGALYRLDAGDGRSELDRVMRLYGQARFVAISRPRRDPSAVPLILRALESPRAA